MSLLEFKHFSNIFEDTSRFRMEECENAMTEEKRISFCQERARANSSVMSVHQTGSYDVCGATLVTTFTIIATNVIKCLHESYAHCTLHSAHEHNLRSRSGFHAFIAILLLSFRFNVS